MFRLAYLFHLDRFVSILFLKNYFIPRIYKFTIDFFKLILVERVPASWKVIWIFEKMIVISLSIKLSAISILNWPDMYDILFISQEKYYIIAKIKPFFFFSKNLIIIYLNLEWTIKNLSEDLCALVIWLLWTYPITSWNVLQHNFSL